MGHNDPWEGHTDLRAERNVQWAAHNAGTSGGRVCNRWDEAEGREEWEDGGVRAGTGGERLEVHNRQLTFLPETKNTIYRELSFPGYIDVQTIQKTGEQLGYDSSQSWQRRIV